MIKAQDVLGYKPEFTILEGIDKVMPWYIALLTNKKIGNLS